MALTDNSSGMYMPVAPAYSNGGFGGFGGDSWARRRDSMGRYSRASEDFRAELEEMMQDAPNDTIRQRMMDMMNEI